MSREQITVIKDDLDGTPITEDDGESLIEFAFGGVDYNIDLNAKNRAKFEKAMAPFVEHATEVEPEPEPIVLPRSATTRRTRSTGGASSGSGRSKEELEAIRAWGRQKGHQISDRGRISANIIEEFDAAHK